MQTNTTVINAVKEDLMLGGKKVTPKVFYQFMESIYPEVDDDVQGVVHYPKFKEDLSNSWMIVVREGIVVKICLQNQPKWVDYYDTDYWANSKISRDRHNFLFHLWIKKLDGVNSKYI
jgi:hypothetical protein